MFHKMLGVPRCTDEEVPWSMRSASSTEGRTCLWKCVAQLHNKDKLAITRLNGLLRCKR